MRYEFDGKVALVTGASGGIGRATAIGFAKSGAVVLVADVNADGGNETVALIEAAGGTAVFQRCNVADSNDVKALVARAVSGAENAIGLSHVLCEMRIDPGPGQRRRLHRFRPRGGGELFVMDARARRRHHRWLCLGQPAHAV